MTCAKDKLIKLWKFPPTWIDEQSVSTDKPQSAYPMEASESNQDGFDDEDEYGSYSQPAQ